MRPPGTSNIHPDFGCGTLVAISATVLLLTLAGVAGQSQQSQTTEVRVSPVSTQDAQSHLVVHAKHALATGKLAKWEAAWYAKIVAGTITPRRITVWVTEYGPWEGFQGDDYHIACNSVNLPLGTVVYMEKTKRLMVVATTGAAYNDVKAIECRAKYWTDVWTRTKGKYGPTGGNTTTTIYILGRAPWPH